MADDRDNVAEPVTVDPDLVDDADDALDLAAPEAEEASDEATESLRELVTYLVEHLVDETENVEILVDRRGSSVHIQLRLPESDLGKVIGRGGRIAKAMRTVLLIAGSRYHLRVTLDIES